jgi:PAT family beta-lactamase induction signal transducer AmpG
VAERSDTAPRRGWRAAWRVYAQPSVARMLLLGFSAGLPLLLVFGTLSFWLREAGVDLKTIGFVSWVAGVYAFKWAWAPLVDRLPLPLLHRLFGRRRSWLLLAQIVVAGGLVGMAFTDPAQDLQRLVSLALLVAFASATQDIALDAYRIESATLEQQAALAAAYQTGYRVAMIWAGAGALWIAARFDASESSYEQAPWMIAYCTMAASMAVGVLTTLIAPEPAPRARVATPANEAAIAAWLAARPTMPRAWARAAAWINSAIVSPFVDFFARYRWQALLVLLLIATYRMSDVVMGVMANPFYRDLGFTKDEIAAVSKVYGVIMTLAGAFLGGLVAPRVGVLRVLMAGALLSAATNLLFAWLATRGHDLHFLIFAISADNLAAGLASSAFIAYLSGLTNVAYSATQYALFSSVMLLLPKFLAGFSGMAVEAIGYSQFFVATAALGLPVLLIVWLVTRALPNGGLTAGAGGPPANDQGSPSQ